MLRAVGRRPPAPEGVQAPETFHGLCPQTENPTRIKPGPSGTDRCAPGSCTNVPFSSRPPIRTSNPPAAPPAGAGTADFTDSVEKGSPDNGPSHSDKHWVIPDLWQPSPRANRRFCSICCQVLWGIKEAGPFAGVVIVALLSKVLSLQTHNETPAEGTPAPSGGEAPEGAGQLFAAQGAHEGITKHLGHLLLSRRRFSLSSAHSYSSCSAGFPGFVDGNSSRGTNSSPTSFFFFFCLLSF